MRNDEFNTVIAKNEVEDLSGFEFGSVQNVEFSFYNDNKINIKDEINESAPSNEMNAEQKKERKQEENNTQESSEKLLEESGSESASSSSSSSSSSSASSAANSSAASSSASAAASSASAVAATVGAVVIAVPSIIAIANVIYSTVVKNEVFTPIQTEIAYSFDIESNYEDERLFSIYIKNDTLLHYDEKSAKIGSNAGTFTGLEKEQEYTIIIAGYPETPEIDPSDEGASFRRVDPDANFSLPEEAEIIYETTVTTLGDDPGPEPPEPPEPGEKVLVGLEMLSRPTKTSYLYGEDLDFDGLQVEAHYSDSTTYPPEILDNSVFTISGDGTSIIGNGRVVLEYEGFSVDFSISVKPYIEYVYPGYYDTSTYVSYIKITEFNLPEDSSDKITDLYIIVDQGTEYEAMYEIKDFDYDTASLPKKYFFGFNEPVTRSGKTRAIDPDESHSFVLVHSLNGDTSKELYSRTSTSKLYSRTGGIYFYLGEGGVNRIDYDSQYEMWPGTHLFQYCLQSYDDLDTFTSASMTLTDSSDPDKYYTYPLDITSDGYGYVDLIEDLDESRSSASFDTYLEIGRGTYEVTVNMSGYMHGEQTSTATDISFNVSRTTAYGAEMSPTYEIDGDNVTFSMTSTYSGFDNDRLGDYTMYIGEAECTKEEARATATATRAASGEQVQFIFSKSDLGDMSFLSNPAQVYLEAPYLNKKVDLYVDCIEFTNSSKYIHNFKLNHAANFSAQTINGSLEVKDTDGCYSNFSVNLSYNDFQETTNFSIDVSSADPQTGLVEFSIDLNSAQNPNILLDENTPKEYAYSLSWYDSETGSEQTSENISIYFGSISFSPAEYYRLNENSTGLPFSLYTTQSMFDSVEIELTDQMDYDNTYTFSYMMKDGDDYQTALESSIDFSSAEQSTDTTWKKTGTYDYKIYATGGDYQRDVYATGMISIAQTPSMAFITNSSYKLYGYPDAGKYYFNYFIDEVTDVYTDISSVKVIFGQNISGDDPVTDDDNTWGWGEQETREFTLYDSTGHTTVFGFHSIDISNLMNMLIAGGEVTEGFTMKYTMYYTLGESQTLEIKNSTATICTDMDSSEVFGASPDSLIISDVMESTYTTYSFPVNIAMTNSATEALEQIADITYIKLTASGDDTYGGDYYFDVSNVALDPQAGLLASVLCYFNKCYHHNTAEDGGELITEEAGFNMEDFIFFLRKSATCKLNVVYKLGDDTTSYTENDHTFNFSY